jgi:hypothetical protein
MPTVEAQSLAFLQAVTAGWSFILAFIMSFHP